MTKDCIWCLKPLEPGDKVRSVHPQLGLVHPQYHIYPDGGDAQGNVISNACAEQHDDEHIHDGECALSYCEKVGLGYVEGSLTLDLDLLQRLIDEATEAHYRSLEEDDDEGS